MLEDLPPVDAPQASPFPVLAYVEATDATPPCWSDGDVAIHVLWTAPAQKPVLRLGGEPGDEAIEHPCAPGDFLLVPPRASFAIGAGILAVLVGTESIQPVSATAPASSQPTVAPTHGLPVFSGYNRQTFGVATANLALCRWKLTGPQAISAPANRPLWLSNLVEPVAISWPGGTDLLGPTESVFLPPGCEITMVPNDLGYVLAAWRPDLQTEVLPPLRSAGYTNAEIAHLGIPQDAMQPGE